MSNFNKEQYVQTIQILFDLDEKQTSGLAKCPVNTLKGLYDSYLKNAEASNAQALEIRELSGRLNNV